MINNGKSKSSATTTAAAAAAATREEDITSTHNHHDRHHHYYNLRDHHPYQYGSTATTTTTTNPVFNTPITQQQQSSSSEFWDDSSSSWHYPLIAPGYLLLSPTLVGSVICTVLWGVLVSITVLLVLFIVALYPQAELLGGGRWWSWIFAIFLVLLESALATLLILKCVHGKTQKRIFVETMKLEKTWNVETMIEPGPDIPCFTKCCCCSISNLLQILTYPLHVFIPILGTVVFAMLNGKYSGLDWMQLYFDAAATINDNLSNEEKQNLVDLLEASSDNACCNFDNPYTKFGFVCQLLESIPIAGPSFFVLSNACATALWASDIERKRKRRRRCNNNCEGPEQQQQHQQPKSESKNKESFYQGFLA